MIVTTYEYSDNINLSNLDNEHVYYIKNVPGDTLFFVSNINKYNGNIEYSYRFDIICDIVNKDNQYLQEKAYDVSKYILFGIDDSIQCIKTCNVIILPVHLRKKILSLINPFVEKNKEVYLKYLELDDTNFYNKK